MITPDAAIALLRELSKTANASLTDTQVAVFRQIWLGQSYAAIAKTLGYDPDYVKQVASKLWKLLSQALKQPVSKRNLQTVFQQYVEQAPVESARVEPARTGSVRYQNLPVCNYSAFVGREPETTALLDFLSFQHSGHCISVEGLGGIGKTALVLAIAHRVQHTPTEFEAIVFVSAKPDRLTPAGILPRPHRERNLRDVLRAIARTLHCTELLLLPQEEQVLQLYARLAQQRTLLVIDNLETVQDWLGLLAFLYDLPATVKVILTSRQYTTFPTIKLSPLPVTESVDLIQQQLKTKGLHLSAAAVQQLHEQTSGVPAAIVYAVGLLSSGRSIQTSIAVLRGEYAHFYFEQSMQSLDQPTTQKLLMALALFATTASREALACVAGVLDEHVLNQGLTKLQQLSLLSQHNGRYDMLPLTREYAIAKLEASPEFKALAQEQLIRWSLDFAATHGGQDGTDWQNYELFEQEWENLEAVIDGCIAQNRYAEVWQFWQSVKGYSHVRGYQANRLSSWSTRLHWTNWLIEAAEQRQDWQVAAEVLFDRAWTLTLIGQPHCLKAAEPLFTRAWQHRTHTDLPFQINLAIHRAAWEIQQQQFNQATQWLHTAAELLSDIDLVPFDQSHDSSHQRLWIRWHYYQGEIAYKTAAYVEATHRFQQVLSLSQAINWRRATFLAKDWLADIALKQGSLTEARALLEEGLQAAQNHQDRCRTAFCLRSLARLEQHQGNRSKAQQWAETAIDTFEQLGMVSEARETIDLLQWAKQG